jgi:hypothetical protein
MYPSNFAKAAGLLVSQFASQAAEPPVPVAVVEEVVVAVVELLEVVEEVVACPPVAVVVLEVVEPPVPLDELQAKRAAGVAKATSMNVLRRERAMKRVLSTRKRMKSYARALRHLTSRMPLRVNLAARSRRTGIGVATPVPWSSG